jgi:hypothetical protein
VLVLSNSEELSITSHSLRDHPKSKKPVRVEEIPERIYPLNMKSLPDELGKLLDVVEDEEAVVISPSQFCHGPSGPSTGYGDPAYNAGSTGKTVECKSVTVDCSVVF